MPARDGELRLIATGEPDATQTLLEDGGSDFVLSCEHAANRLPRALGDLGLSDTALQSHVAWDIGAGHVTRLLSQRLQACALLHQYSRLAIDCNRPLTASDSIAVEAEWGVIPGNQQVDAAQRAARAEALFVPFHDRMRQILDRRRAQHRRSLLVAVHSFTPRLRGVTRPWDIGLMYRKDARLATPVLEALRRDERLIVGDNQPYAIDDEFDYTLPEHGERRGIAHLGLEIRQDLIADEAGQTRWAGRLASLLRQVAQTLDAG